VTAGGLGDGLDDLDAGPIDFATTREGVARWT
jgi:hypothetical protein